MAEYSPIPSLKEQLRDMTPRSLLFKLIKDEMIKRGHWQNLPRGKADKRHFTGVNTHLQNSSQVSDDNGGSIWGV